MPGNPHGGSKVWKAPDREIGKPGKNRGKVIAHREFQPAAAFHDRENLSKQESQPASATGIARFAKNSHSRNKNLAAPHTKSGSE